MHKAFETYITAQQAKIARYQAENHPRRMARIPRMQARIAELQRRLADMGPDEETRLLELLSHSRELMQDGEIIDVALGLRVLWGHLDPAQSRGWDYTIV